MKRAVAPREGCVSRNFISVGSLNSRIVAPRKGCVSRNYEQAGRALGVGLHPARGV